ncbi:MAG TPA: nucleotide exchange factor GrpE [Vicinamibacteria bacterium]|jgi:molecular chaperone GrpE|nr:nucleotide exchange factor GrpE [Vicinamibacteria bacterium]
MSKGKGKGIPETSPPESLVPPGTVRGSGESPLPEAPSREQAGEGGMAPAPAGVPPSREEFEALKRAGVELQDQLLRKRADFENYRKRVERDRQQATVDAVAAIFRDLIPTLDNLERALKAGGGEEALRTGVELTQRELLSFLDSHGVVAQEPVGQKFDPQNHEALLHEPVPGYEEGTVVEVFRKGYSFKDRLLRPALVKVAKGETTDDTAEPDEIH